MTFHQGSLYISEGGHPGRISRLDFDGKQTVILDKLPGPGNYHTNMVATSTLQNWAGQIFVALFGDEAPMTAPPGAQVGRSVARIDPWNWSLHPFIQEPLARPIDVQFHPTDGRIYMLDFGKFEMHAGWGVVAEAETGRLWRYILS